MSYVAIHVAIRNHGSFTMSPCVQIQRRMKSMFKICEQITNLSSSELSSDSTHVGILATAALAAANNSPFTVFYNLKST
ncbi:auxin response factor 19-like [Durio zibethinus]|uniref:Auxin response factor 19-like n=1 Tax=Durio zibethinus TaxID=66656 RepID=A0A6P5YFV8_DURZI|nr:auxin response factor 19-like [Durio zibethinus]